MKRTLRYIECDIVGHCNLNCKACSHFSNIQKEEDFVSLESYERDLKRLKELFFKIEIIKILGGEPLLHPQLGKIIEVTREVYPKAKILINTNGILIRKLDKKVLETIRKCNVQVNVTLYESIQKLKEEMTEILEENNICYKINDEKFKFHRRLTEEKRERKWASHFDCSIKYCTGFRNGFLGKCPMSIHISRFNKKFATNYLENECIDIHDKKTTARKIKRFIKKPINLCNYCSTKQEWVEWDKASYEEAKKEDWICKCNTGTKLDNIKGYFRSKFPTKKSIDITKKKIKAYLEKI